VITRAGLVRFWIGTVLIVLCTVVALGAARTAADEPLPWLIAIGAGLVGLALCVGLWRRRVAQEPDAMRVDLPRYEPVSVIVAIGLLADLLFVAVELYNLTSAHRLDTFWVWPPMVILFVGFLLVFSLGDYAP